MPFLYFPEDKAEYIPAVLTLALFTILAIITMYFMIKKSRKDEQHFREEYENRIDRAEHSQDRSNS